MEVEMRCVRADAVRSLEVRLITPPEVPGTAGRVDLSFDGEAAEVAALELEDGATYTVSIERRV